MSYATTTSYMLLYASTLLYVTISYVVTCYNECDFCSNIATYITETKPDVTSHSNYLSIYSRLCTRLFLRPGNKDDGDMTWDSSATQKFLNNVSMFTVVESTIYLKFISLNVFRRFCMQSFQRSKTISKYIYFLTSPRQVNYYKHVFIACKMYTCEDITNFKILKV
jgi:hypothetical protein